MFIYSDLALNRVYGSFKQSQGWCYGKDRLRLKSCGNSEHKPPWYRGTDFALSKLSLLAY
jgi:hypothetical protein